jgi:nucleoside-diphosphate-sugar epimerase
MKVFVTGATGVIGHRAVPLLVQAGHRVTAVGRTPEKRAALTETGAEAVELDLFDREAVRRAVQGHEVVVNLATRIPATMGRLFRPGAFEENDRLRRDASAILSAATREAGIERLVQESFAGIYDDAGDAWVDEAAAVRPVRYARTVLDAEASANRFTESGGAGVVLRFAAFYGPDSLQVREMARVVRWGWSPLPGRPEAYFSSVHLDDAASAVVAALGVPAGVYNVADDEPVTRRVFVDALADAQGVKPPRFAPAWAASLMGELGEAFSRSVRLSNRRLRVESGWAPQYPSVREGWPAVVDAWRAAGT